MNEVGAPTGPRVVAAGEFDGLHCGHRLVLARVVEQARARRGAAMVLLHRLRRDVIRVMTAREQFERLAALGIDTLVLADSATASSAIERVHPSLYVTAQHTARPAQVPADIVARCCVDGVPVSAAAVRTAIAAGDLDTARRMLGREPGVSGKVIHGFHRGAPLGIPTANLRVGGVQLPPDGVYAVRARAGDVARSGVANIGFNPTFANRNRSVETHLLDFSGDLYGSRLHIEFVARLRGELRFDGVDALLAQIRADIAAARKLFGTDG